MLDFNPAHKKVILSVDGGGTRGMISIAMLAELETMTGKTCPELFDLVAGTSTGAVIAAGIGLGMSAQELLEQVYRQRLPEAFRRQPHGLLLYLRYLVRGLRSLYDFEPFVEAVGSLAKGRKIGELQKPIVFMTTRDLRTNNTYYIVSKGPGAAKFADWPVVGAAGASGAAPIYFPPVLGNLVDGGVGMHGNPCLAATVEAMEYIGAAEGFTDNNVMHLSLGTGYRANVYPNGAGKKLWLYDWVTYITAGFLDDANLQQVLNTRTIYKNRVDVRRYNPYLDKHSVEQHLGIPLAGRPAPDKLELDAAAPEQIQLMEDIGRAYAHCINWDEPGYLPWQPADGQGRDGGHPLPGILPVDWKNSPYG